MTDWPLLADLPAKDVRELLAVARRRTFEKGEVVFHRDDPTESLHLIVRGRFAASVVTAVGDSVLLDVLGPGQAFGELALLLPGERRSATVSALEDGEDDLAAMAGASRATVNRVLRDEEKRGAVVLGRGRITLLDVRAIRQRCRLGRS